MANLRAKLLQNIQGMWKEVLYDIFVYTHKVYDALDWGFSLEILEGCGVVPQVLPTPDPILISGNHGGKG